MALRYLPGATFRPISYRLAAGPFSAPPLGYIVHVPVSNGSLFRYFNGLKSPGRKFSHAWIAKDGSAEQYQTLDLKAWAQGDGNGTYWSFEVEGFPGEPMTGPQLDTLARWHTFLGTADHIATAPGQKGIGTHQMGGSAWGGHSCPGAIRTAQLPQIITRAHGAPPSEEDDMPTPADLLAAPLGTNPADKSPSTVGEALDISKNYSFLGWQAVRALGAQVAALSAAVNTLAKDGDVEAVKAAIADALDDYTLTLTKENA